MKYVQTVEANIWDSSNEAQVDKIIDWLTIKAPFMFELDDEGLRVQTESGIHDVKDGEAIILDPNKNRPEVMNGRTFKAIYTLLTEED